MSSQDGGCLREKEAMDIKAKMPGKIIELKAKAGDAVKKGDLLLVMEAMKMKNSVLAPGDGIVKEVKVENGGRVNAGQVMLVME
jgi:glutaconyl-CoA decarboxylase